MSLLFKVTKAECVYIQQDSSWHLEIVAAVPDRMGGNDRMHEENRWKLSIRKIGPAVKGNPLKD